MGLEDEETCYYRVVDPITNLRLRITLRQVMWGPKQEDAVD
jgi:hypothetical protein